MYSPLAHAVLPCPWAALLLLQPGKQCHWYMDKVSAEFLVSTSCDMLTLNCYYWLFFSEYRMENWKTKIFQAFRLSLTSCQSEWLVKCRVCMCVCVWQREREREREGACSMHVCTYVQLYNKWSLCRYTNSELVVKYARWALERDEELATKIFTEREDNSEVLSPHRVLEYLHSFPVATVSYLEHIIRNKGLKVSNTL